MQKFIILNGVMTSSAARNAALKYVTGDWVLVLDADETLTPGIVPQLREAIARDEYLLINLVRQG